MTTIASTRDDRAAVDKAVSLLTSFGSDASTGLGVSELARRAGLSKSTAFRVLGMLERNRVIERVGSSYRFGQRLHELGSAVYSAEHDRISETITPFLADLYEMTHETVHLAALHGLEVVYLAKLYGHRRVQTPSRIGGRVPAHCTAVGKALLAHTPDAYEAIGDAKRLCAMTDHSITDPAALIAQLMRVRRDGVAFEEQEASMGLSCVAVPILGAGGVPVAGLSVSGAHGSFNARLHAPALIRVSQAASLAVQRAGLGASAGVRVRAIA